MAADTDLEQTTTPPPPLRQAVQVSPLATIAATHERIGPLLGITWPAAAPGPRARRRRRAPAPDGGQRPSPWTTAGACGKRPTSGAHSTSSRSYAITCAGEAHGDQILAHGVALHPAAGSPVAARSAWRTAAWSPGSPSVEVPRGWQDARERPTGGSPSPRVPRLPHGCERVARSTTRKGGRGDPEPFPFDRCIGRGRGNRPRRRRERHREGRVKSPDRGPV